MKLALTLPLLLVSTGAFQSPHVGTTPSKINDSQQRAGWSSPAALTMKPVSTIDGEIVSDNRRFANNSNKKIKQQVPYLPRTSLSAASLDSAEQQSSSLLGNFAGVGLSVPKGVIDLKGLQKNDNVKAIAQVLSASLLVTGNTVGSGMFVLPEAVGGVGMISGSSIFFGLHLFNLISGLLLAEVAINLHENSECEVPSSFKDFADAAMPHNSIAGNAIGAASLVLNGSILSFGIVHAGNLLVSAFPELGLDPATAAAGFAALIATSSITQTNEGLKNIANAACIGLFTSFFSLLFSAQVEDPMTTLLAPGTHPDGFIAGVSDALPLLFSVLIFQNIVPSLTKLLNFDRTKTTTSIAIGSAVPMFMYIAWCYAVLGGGLDSSTSGANAVLFTTFSASALVGSCTACVMSLSEEFESIISSVKKGEAVEPCPLQDRFSFPAVALSITPPALLACTFANGGDFTAALHFGGAFISPFLYGILPIMLFQSMNKNNDGAALSTSVAWNIPQAVLGVGTMGFLAQEISHDVAHFQSMLS